MKIYGRVISIRKTKNYVFLIINSKDKKQIQIVIEKEKYENIEKNDIISVDAIIDINNNNGESYIAKKVSKVALGKKEESLKFNENALIIKSKITHNVRNFLSDERFIEIDLPILSFSENSSSSHSFKAKHDISDDTVSPPARWSASSGRPAPACASIPAWSRETRSRRSSIR